MGAGVVLGYNSHLLPGFTVIGIVLGGVYALAAVGLVLIYRVSGVLNFAHGAVAMFATFTAYEVSTVRGAPGWVGALVAIFTGAALGFVIEWLTIRPLQGRPAVGHQREPGDGGVVDGRLGHGRSGRRAHHAAHRLRHVLADGGGHLRLHRRPHRPALQPADDRRRRVLPRAGPDVSPGVLVAV